MEELLEVRVDPFQREEKDQHQLKRNLENHLHLKRESNLQNQEKQKKP